MAPGCIGSRGAAIGAGSSGSGSRRTACLFSATGGAAGGVEAFAISTGGETGSGLATGAFAGATVEETTGGAEGRGAGAGRSAHQSPPAASASVTPAAAIQTPRLRDGTASGSLAG